uniref:Uncharacterized protein n=1 Tax=Syphacia muris TaxID=451379 RepID=A0A0N5AHF4_9BILA
MISDEQLKSQNLSKIGDESSSKPCFNRMVTYISLVPLTPRFYVLIFCGFLISLMVLTLMRCSEDLERPFLNQTIQQYPPAYQQGIKTATPHTKQFGDSSLEPPLYR